MDGSQKLPQRILGTLADNQAAGQDSPGLILAIAAWMIYVGGTDLRGQPIDVRDPMAARLRATLDGKETVEGKVSALLAIGAIFPNAFSVHQSCLVQAYKSLKLNGARAAVETLS
jgi:fructuronate reductase